MTSESLHSDSDSLEQAEMLAVLGTAPSKAAVTPQASEAHTNSGSAPDYADRHHEIHINSDQITLYEHHMANFRRMDSNDAYMQDKYILYDLSALQSHDSRDRLDSSLSRIALRANYWDTKHQQVLDSHRHYIPVMLALSTDRLPKELVLRILAVRASSMLSELVIDKKKTLYKAAENLLGREAPNELVQIMENTILEVVPIRLVDVNFIRKDTAATMVDFLHSSISTSQMSSLRSLVLTIDVASLPPDSQHGFIEGAITQSPSFPNPTAIDLATEQSSRPVKEKCSAGYTAPITYGVAFERLVTAAQSTQVGRRQVFALRTTEAHRNPEAEPALSTFKWVDIDTRSATELVKQAMEWA
ncbi:hypothetical protein LTR10_011424 [Elasticomyces elasticus]|nr:hypothetical protein LTR10_011424 [Elasticomyces elasticus]